MRVKRELVLLGMTFSSARYFCKNYLPSFAPELGQIFVEA